MKLWKTGHLRPRQAGLILSLEIYLIHLYYQPPELSVTPIRLSRLWDSRSAKAERQVSMLSPHSHRRKLTETSGNDRIGREIETAPTSLSSVSSRGNNKMAILKANRSCGVKAIGQTPNFPSNPNRLREDVQGPKFDCGGG